MSALPPPVAEFGALPPELASFRPRVAMVLGSGLGSFADAAEKLFEVPYSAVAGLPESNVPGHAGKFVGATLGGLPLLLAMGRVHFYEGHTARQIAAHVRLMASLGPSVLILTNAAGTLNPAFAPGGWMMISDQLNLTAASPLSGGPNFFDMSEIYDAQLRAVFRGVAAGRGMPLHEGVYACVPGPQYETPAEVRMLRTLGADAVGMSTVFEAVQARALGLRVAAFSCLTNWAAGVSSEPLSHDEVMDTGRQAASALVGLLQDALRGGLPPG
ncbi:MAG: purine-nucleoside phosphorylase [Chthoniobacterales bacterium]|jgi:purine-nucleoside phosphorylase|nr:purine-nucleoside phosphorylase [Chthoniobacterales bacterium]